LIRKGNKNIPLSSSGSSNNTSNIHSDSSQNGIANSTIPQSSNAVSSTTSSSTPVLTAPPASTGLALFQSALSQLLNNSVVEVMEALETLLVYTRNLILYPEKKKYRKIKLNGTLSRFLIWKFIMKA